MTDLKYSSENPLAIVHYSYAGLIISESTGHGKNVSGNKKTSTIRVVMALSGTSYYLLSQFNFPVHDRDKKRIAIRKCERWIDAYNAYPVKNDFRMLKRGVKVYLNVPKVYINKSATVSKIDFPYIFLKGQFTFGRITKYNVNFISLKPLEHGTEH